ncbi:MAG TPA: sigma-E factor regulatory protein RseB domain-containing protein [Bryobacteraceae bacterium]|nr:sigma-E factor regulatory protein RseB domain-containing protein [Bryobacteraceae bacterium]HUO27699.1 sigma-E factor regulatory protein RseB domain-containing protein [Bryobacteraceae bacterium]
MKPLALLSVFAAALAGGTVTNLPGADEVVAAMMEHDNARQSALGGYTGLRRYVLENARHHKRAEMLVRVTCARDGSKQFEMVSSTGWGGARKYVFGRLLDAESEASRPGARDQSRVTPENYWFEMAGRDQVDGRDAYVLNVAPKEPKKYLFRGKIWVDAEEYAIVRIAGAPAKNPSFWVKSVHFAHTYEKHGLFWFPASNDSVTDVRIFGSTELRIDYFDYQPNSLPVSIAGDLSE